MKEILLLTLHIPLNIFSLLFFSVECTWTGFSIQYVYQISALQESHTPSRIGFMCIRFMRIGIEHVTLLAVSIFL